MKYWRFHIALIFFLSWILTFPGISQENEVPREYELRLPVRELSIGEILEEVDKQTGLIPVYNRKTLPENEMIVPESSLITTSAVIRHLNRETSLDLSIRGNYLLIKTKDPSETRIISGYIRDKADELPLTGASVFIEGTGTGGVTNREGRYSFKAKIGEYRIICRYMGYATTYVDIRLFSDKEVNFNLDRSINALSEVEIRGQHDSFNRPEIRSSIEHLDTRQIGQVNVNNLSEALVGRVKGVWATKTSGAPGDQNRIRIRGINSILSSSEPLYVIDGHAVPVLNLRSPGISGINIHDVESVTVLKDASSTAAYGFQGGNGVILIETRKAEGEGRLNFSSRHGVQVLRRRYDLMESPDFLYTLHQFDTLLTPRFYPYKTNTVQRYPLYKNDEGVVFEGSDDWQDRLFRTGTVHEYQLSGSGEWKKTRFYLSGNLFGNQGVVRNSEYTRYSLFTNLNRKLGKNLHLDFSWRASSEDNRNNLEQYKGNGHIFKGISIEPGFEYTEQEFLDSYERLYFNPELKDLGEGDAMSLLANTRLHLDSLLQREKRSGIINHALNLSGRIRIRPHLELRARISGDYRGYTNISDNPGINYLRVDEGLFSLNQSLELAWEKWLGKHYLSAQAGYRRMTDNAWWEVDTAMGVDLDGVRKERDTYIRGSQSIYGQQGATLRNISSGIGRIDYNYAGKYSLSGILNYSRLDERGTYRKTAVYPSLAAKWQLEKEEIFRLPGFMDYLNLTASWGISGNYPLNSLAGDLYTQVSIVRSGEEQGGGYLSNLANKNLRNEEVREYNIGLELGLFKHRLVLNADYFDRENRDLILRRAIPTFYGSGTMLVNVGEMNSSGWELSLDAGPFNLKNFSWFSRFVYSSTQQVPGSLDVSDTLYFMESDILMPEFRVAEGERMGSILGYRCLGAPTEEELGLSAEQGVFTDAGGNRVIIAAGMKYRKNDSAFNYLNEADKEVIGNSIPDFTLSWYNRLRFKNFELDMLWYAVSGNDKFNATRAATYLTGVNREVRDYVTGGKHAIRSIYFYESSCFVEDASFIRLKTVTLTYRYPEKVFGKTELSVSVSAENLVTLTAYRGYDPEATIYTDNNFSDNAVDLGAYPNPQGYYVKINLAF